MLTKNQLKIFLFCLLLFPVSIGYAQQKSKSVVTRNWQINYNLGFSQFYGDASNNGYFKKFSGETSFATGITARKYLSPVFGLGLNLWYSGVKSYKDKNASGEPVSFSLTGKYFDGNVNLLIDFSNLFWGVNSRKFSVYGIIGLGYGSWNTQLVDSLSGGTINSGDVIGDLTYESGGLVVPVGVGVNYMLNDNWALNFEMNLRTILNDDVDVWRDGFKYDQLLYTSVGVSYFINTGGKTKSKTKKVQSSSGPVKPGVPVYDYRLQSPSTSSIASKPEIELIEPEMPSGIVYRVQILAKRNNLPTIESLKMRFNITGNIYENIQNSIHRYSTGTFSTYKEALRHSYLIRDKGVHDAFVVAYQNNTRVNITAEMKKY